VAQEELARVLVEVLERLDLLGVEQLGRSSQYLEMSR
jgi:hypothetical protein